MEKKAFYTVAEAAELLGVSRQAIYQALNKQLKPFSSKVDGKIAIDAAAFSNAVDKQLDKEKDKQQLNIQVLVQEVEKLKIQLDESGKREKMLADQLEYLKQQIKIKDETIEGLRTALDQQQKLQLLTQQQPKQIGGFFKRLFGHKDG